MKQLIYVTLAVRKKSPKYKFIENITWMEVAKL